jgi:hypothetical protein
MVRQLESADGPFAQAASKHIKDEVALLAKEYGVATTRVHRILERTACDFHGNPVLKLPKDPEYDGHGFGFSPHSSGHWNIFPHKKP